MVCERTIHPDSQDQNLNFGSSTDNLCDFEQVSSFRFSFLLLVYEGAGLDDLNIRQTS